MVSAMPWFPQVTLLKRKRSSRKQQPLSTKDLLSQITAQDLMTLESEEKKRFALEYETAFPPQLNQSLFDQALADLQATKAELESLKLQLQSSERELAKTKLKLDRALLDNEQATHSRETLQLELEQHNQSLLKFAPKIRQVLGSKPIKLNVGGKSFATTLDNLIREPRTFFSLLFGGQAQEEEDDHAWEQFQELFIDRDPSMFGRILNYLRTGDAELKSLKDDFERAKLKSEAEFYQIHSLVDQMSQGVFYPITKNRIKLCNQKSVAANEQVGANSYAISLTPFTPTFMQKRVKVLKGKRILIGVSTRAILEPASCWSNTGFFMWCADASLCSQNGECNAPYQNQTIWEGSVVTVTLDHEFNVSFAVDDVDWGTAFLRVAKDHSVPLHLAIGFDYDADRPQELQECAVLIL